MKKYTNKTSIYKKIVRAFMRNRRKNATVLILALAVVLISGAGLYDQYLNKADKDRAVGMRNMTQLIRDELYNADPDYAWPDRSYCTTVAASAFGERTQYSCTAHYQSSKPVKDQEDIKYTFDSHFQIINATPGITFDDKDSVKVPIFTSNSVILDRPSYYKLAQTSAYMFGLAEDGAVKCTMRYELVNDELKKGVYLKSDLNCFMPTRAAYFQPIKNK